MEQETTILQKKKQLTFEELCPLWNQFLKMESKNGFFFVDDRFQTDPSNIGKLCSMKHFDKCVVGEANGWSADYYHFCDECKTIAGLFGAQYDSGIFARIRSPVLAVNIEKLRDMFMNHWNDKHL